MRMVIKRKGDIYSILSQRQSGFRKQHSTITKYKIGYMMEAVSPWLIDSAVLAYVDML